MLEAKWFVHVLTNKHSTGFIMKKVTEVDPKEIWSRETEYIITVIIIHTFLQQYSDIAL